MRQSSPDQSSRDSVEAQLARHHQSGAWRATATLAIETYGAELLRFAGALLRSADWAEEVFAKACERLWTGLPRFRRQCTFRVWLLTIVRHECWRQLASPERRRRCGLSAAGPLSEVVAGVRTRTSSCLRSGIKDKVASLRASLSVEEQTLLALRVDRELAWSDIVVVLAGSDAIPSDRERKRREALLRKRFERLKARLRLLAKEHGLLDG